jgi:transposase InsO family protein
MWRKAYREKGPKGLERLSSGEPKRRGAKPMPLAKREAILHVAREHASFGLRKVRDFLARFRAIRVSTGSVRKTLRSAGIPPKEARQRRRRRAFGPPRRFERSRPGELWQSDITYLDVPWSRKPLYLVAFLDDFSRYVVSAGIFTNQKQDIVIEAFSEAVLRFGKPKEVLTDQGRQYFTWRGKNEFQRLLQREGVAHVVARAHHPQTVGKCERFWETIQGELWESVRGKVRDLADARARLSHFLAHYNHFRPHQGLEGLTPADRFFGASSEVRRALEGAMEKNEYRLAVDEAPRRPLFLVGQIGEQSIALHGEQGRVVVEMADGTRRELLSEEVERERADEQRTGGDQADAADAHGAKANDVSGSQDAAGGSRPLESGERGGEGERASTGGGDPSGVAGQALAAGGGQGPRDGAAAVLAALPAGGGGDGGGVPKAAASEEGTAQRPRDVAGRVAPGEEDPRARGGPLRGAAADRDPEGAAGQPREGERGDGGCSDGRPVR